ncbi:MAG: excinuclease ABC subunit UvrA [Bacteroidales bacterium]|nr:excinuclease ABC subunit UvrA [Bacteroidales bacterium]
MPSVCETHNQKSGYGTQGTDITVHGARVNNLKNIDVTIPRNKFTVITGLSGSGKSSLAFDTLYAEGQRRYVESLSAYARQFLGRMHKPECEYIKGLPPAIAIEQKVNTRNPRSTVGTSTEIYDFMRLLFGRVGRTYSPVSGNEVKRHTVAHVMADIESLPEGTRIAITAPVVMPDKRRFATQLEVYVKAGYTRLFHDGRFVDMAQMLAEPDKIPETATDYELLVDRLSVSTDTDDLARAAESVEAAFFEGHDVMHVHVFDNSGAVSRRMEYSTAFSADGMTFTEPSEQMFNFNNPYGACPRCEGFGRVLGIDEALVIPDPSRSVFDDAVICWRGEKMSEWKREFIHEASPKGFPIHRPYNDLTDAEKDMLWHGIGASSGIDGFFKWVETQQHKIQYRVMLARYRGKTVCPECHGHRLRKDADYVRIGGKNIGELVQMPVSELSAWFKALELSDDDARIAQRIMLEITSRLHFLEEVGLGYLTLNRLSNSLSGGESQRINLATSLGSSLVGSLYILDEPSIGLHSRDTQRLIKVLHELRDIGNTVVVVEHDEEIMRAADHIIDVGPRAGRLGGEIVYSGPISGLASVQDSYTAKYLDGRLTVPVPAKRRKWRSSITVKGARQHNLKNIDVTFPLGVMTVVTGVSGSGKSTLVRDILWRAMVRELGEAGDAPGRFDGLEGDIHAVKAVEFIDQNPIGKSSRSNPATYLKAYDEIRRLYADQQLSQQMGYTPAFFSFNAEGGRCEECKGEGTITIEMQFMSDITVECEACHGQRFKPEILEVRYCGKNISDILDMTVDQAIAFFAEDSANKVAARIVSRLNPLAQVGLGYIKLGQASSTLSGGENQRVKLAYFLSQEKPEPTLFIFDEPTTGLHFEDISTLMRSFDRLLAHGHTIIIIEHNMDVVKCADHVIDIGPEGGDAGGNIVVVGTPEQVAGCPTSYTGHFLTSRL